MKTTPRLVSMSSEANNVTRPIITCRLCKQERMQFYYTPWCVQCMAQMGEGSHPRQVQARRERDERIAAYMGKPRMGFVEFTFWLDYYSFNVDADMHFVLVLWIRWGSDLPAQALLTDHPELEHAVLMREDKRPDLHNDWHLN